MISRKGTVKQILSFRSYEIQLADGTTRWRSSKHVLLTAEAPIVMREDNRDTTWLMESIRQYWYINIKLVAQSSFAANNQLDGVGNSSSGEPVVVKTRSGRVVVPPPVVNRTNWINKPCNDWSTSVWLTCWDCLYRTKVFCWCTPF